MLFLLIILLIKQCIAFSTKLLSSTTLFDIDNNNNELWLLKKCLPITEMNYILKYCTTNLLKCNNISQYYSFDFIFGQINSAF